MNNQIKAIETQYKGYRFRSRLEARWAVFFDMMGIKWEYEMEGYELYARESDESVWYLPDFFLPQVDMFVEVKADEFSDRARFMCELLARNSGYSVLMLDGTPDYKEYEAVLSPVSWDYSDEIWDEKNETTIAIPHGECNFASRNYYTISTAYLDEDRFYCCGCPQAGDTDYFDFLSNGMYTIAVNAARSARFEFGENPEPLTEAVEFHRKFGKDYDIKGWLEFDALSPEDKEKRRDERYRAIPRNEWIAGGGTGEEYDAKEKAESEAYRAKWDAEWAEEYKDSRAAMELCEEQLEIVNEKSDRVKAIREDPNRIEEQLEVARAEWDDAHIEFRKAMDYYEEIRDEESAANELKRQRRESLEQWRSEEMFCSD